MEAWEDREAWRSEIAERRRLRRAEDRELRRTFRRRRLTAGVGLVAVIAIAAVAVSALVGGSAPTPAAGSADQPTAHGPTRKASGRAPASADLPDPEMISDFRSSVPILMYHVITPAPIGAANPGLFIPPKELRAQLRWLAHNGYTPVTLSDVLNAWNKGTAIPSKPIVLTFDDGTADQHDIAAPLLARYGWAGVLDLPIHSLNEHELTDGDVQEMIGEGWELASHSRTHPDLTTLDETTLEDEVAGSRRALQRRFGVPVNFFCYPAGSYDDAAIAAVRAAGYEGATTELPGAASPDDSPYELPRIRMEPGDGADGLAAKLAAAGV